MINQSHRTGIHLKNYVRYMVADYAPLGKPYTMTIKWVTEADWYNKKARQFEKCPSLVFEETSAQLRLTSHENCRTMARLFGPDADAWIGKTILICAEEMALGYGDGGKKRTIKIVGEGKPKQADAAPKQPAATATNGNDINWDTASADDLRAWAASWKIGTESVDAALDQAGGLIVEAHSILEKAMVTK